MTKEELIKQIQNAGQFIIDNAESMLDDDTGIDIKHITGIELNANVVPNYGASGVYGVHARIKYIKQRREDITVHKYYEPELESYEREANNDSETLEAVRCF